MSAENKTLIRRYFEAIDAGNLAALDDLVASTFIRHDPNAAEIKSLADLKRHLRMVYTATPDLRHTIEDMVAEGDRVALRLTARGTHTGDFMGIPPTGKPVTVTGTGICRIADGKIQEDWFNSDALGLLQQLGVVPK
jgi:steroid delta-isomerase-like uncharacterized protein